MSTINRGEGVTPPPSISTNSPIEANYTQSGGSAPVVTPVRQSFFARPLGIALIVVAALVVGAIALVALMSLMVNSRKADREVMRHDFAAEPDKAQVVEPGLAWEQQDGQLRLFTTSPTLQHLDFDIPSSSTAKVVATLTQPAYNGAPEELAWGVMARNDSGGGVALLCMPNGAPQLLDLASSETLGFGGGGGTCAETMQMTLEVSGTVVSFQTDTGGSLAYSGNIDYGRLDSVGVGLASGSGEQTLQVSEITAYEP